MKLNLKLFLLISLVLLFVRTENDNSYQLIEPTTYTIDSTSGKLDGDEGTEKLFDGSSTTKYYASSADVKSIDGYSGFYVVFHTPNQVQVAAYKLITGTDSGEYSGRNPKSWIFQAKKSESDDWNIIDTKSNYNMPAANCEEVLFELNQIGVYKYFRIIFTETGDGAFQLSELNLLEPPKAIYTYINGCLGYETNYKSQSIIDGDQSTKWYAGVAQKQTLPDAENDNTAYWWIDFSSNRPLDIKGYTLSTANDANSYPERNPIYLLLLTFEKALIKLNN